MKQYLTQRPHIVIFLVALGCAAVVGLTSFFVMEIYRTVQPIWVEQAAYGQWPMVMFFQRLRLAGFFPTLQALGGRHPLQVTILGLIVPSLLEWFHAPLLVVLPFFAIFLSLFGWIVYKRTQQLGYAVAAMLLYGAVAELTRHNWGIGSGFADWQSMFLLNAAVLCLLNALMQPGLAWIRAFAVLVCLATLARVTAAFHAFAMCGPILLIYMMAHYKRYRSWRLLGTHFLNILVIVAPAAFVVIRQLPDLLAYYNPSHAWNLRQSFITSANNIFFTLLGPFMGIPLIVFCVILFNLNMYRYVLSKQNSRMDHSFGWTELAAAWWGFGFIFYLLLNGYTSDVPKEVMYAVPPLLFGAVTPFTSDKSRPAIELKRLALLIMTFSIISFGWYTVKNMIRAGTITSEQANWRQTQLEMAGELSKMPPGIRWQSYTLVDWSIPVSLLTLYEYGEFRESPQYFFNRKEYWDGVYPGLSLPELEEKLYTKTMNCIDVAIVLKDPEQQPPQMEDYSYSIAAFIARSMGADPRWRLEGVVNARPFGTQFTIYRNTEVGHSTDCSK
ncbi:MAG: hypothetical protein AB1649_02530 [Chloroflexota bacterium]